MTTNSQEMFGGQASKPPPRPPVRHFIYECTSCHRKTERTDLTVKRAVFKTMGEKGKTIRSRTTGWLCEECRAEDKDWNMEKLMSSPGMADVKAN